LQNNALTTRSLKKLSRVIALSAGDLRELDLSGNEIRVVTPEQGLGWQQFLDSFRHCYMLKKLDFSHNPLGPRGIEILARVYMRSELDFVEVDGEDDVAGNASQLEVLSGGFTSLRIENNNQENERPLARASDGQHSKSRPLQSSKCTSLIFGFADNSLIITYRSKFFIDSFGKDCDENRYQTLCKYQRFASDSIPHHFQRFDDRCLCYPFVKCAEHPLESRTSPGISSWWESAFPSRSGRTL
jgi:hypothetical protein